MKYRLFPVLILAVQIVIFARPASCESSDVRGRQAACAVVVPERIVSCRQFQAACEFQSKAGMVLRLQALSPGIIRVQLSKDGKFSGRDSFVIDSKIRTQSYPIKLREEKDLYCLQTEELLLSVDKETLALTFGDKRGNIILADQTDPPLQFSGKRFQVFKISPEDEHYFGLGDKTTSFDRRNQALTFWNTDPPLFQESSDPLYKSVPFLLALRNGNSYGIYLDNTYRSYFDFCKSRPLTFSFGAEDGALDYYFIYGPAPKQVLSRFSELAGRMPLPPRFALGYQQSRGSYVPEAKVKEVAKKLREHKIPCDVIYLDGDYKQDARPFTVDKKLFPDFAGLVKALLADGFKTVISLDPYIAKKESDPNFETGLKEGYFARNPDGSVFLGKVWPGDVAFADFTRSSVRKWWGGLHSEFLDAGVRGIWDDMNEPAVFERADRTMPLDTVHYVEERKTDHREVHNVFAMQNTRAAYEGMLMLKPDLRPFVLTRSGFAGSWKYAATWTGDNTSTWNHMRISVPQLLNLGLSGWCFAGSDIGGFNGFASGPSPELLTRWMQLGAFNPLFRNHSDGCTRPREPWVDGPEHEAVRRRFIEMRYKLMPYIYTCMEEASRTGIPLMRAMFLEFPQEKSLATNCEQYMFGPHLLIAPRLWEIPGSYSVSLPKGNWFAYGNSQEVRGDKCLSVDPSIADMPIFVRGGAVLAEEDLKQFVDEKPQGPLRLRVYRGEGQTESLIYMDDGESMAYKNGAFLRQRILQSNSPDRAEFEISAAEGDFVPETLKIEISLIGFRPGCKLLLDKIPVEGRVNGVGELVLPAVPWSKKGHKLLIQY